MKQIHIISGGTLQHIAPHLALAAPAYGTVGKQLYRLCREHAKQFSVCLHLTRMAGGPKTLETNSDVKTLLQQMQATPSVKIIFMPVALCDFAPSRGRQRLRLRTSGGSQTLSIQPTPKLLPQIRQERKDIFLVGFKTTTDATPQMQFVTGLDLLKTASANLVLANDLITGVNMVITPEEARYHETTDRHAALTGLVEMAVLRSQLTFTRSTVVAGEPVPWTSADVPYALRTVVDYCIQQGAYKPFNGATVGHFAAKIADNVFLTSIRKTNFNQLAEIGLVRIQTDGPDTVIAYGAKPSVGGQSQRIVFDEHPEVDCIVHFHCPKKPGSLVPEVSQREYECGSHECGRNTSRGLQRFGNLLAVYLQEHGPNIVFHRSINPQEVIDFIEANFELSQKTGGYVNLGQILRTPDTLQTLQGITDTTQS